MCVCVFQFIQFKYRNVSHCTSQTDVLMLVLICIWDYYDGALAPKYVGVFKTNLQFVVLLCASVGKCDGMRDRVWHLYKTTGKIIVLYTQ
jgi:hypothetical protein